MRKQQATPHAVKLIVNVFDEFFNNQLCSGGLLLVCTVVALVWANSRFGAFYEHIDYLYAGIHLGHFSIKLSLSHWVNDGLMAVFFLLVGLEIKREILAGELSALSSALLPIVAAIGGMVVPALIYWFFNRHNVQTIQGWAIPMATDIAFALGLMALMGKRVPRSLIVFLAAIAIVDDLGSILVIAIFYSANIEVTYLLYAGLCFALLCSLNLLRVKRLTPYLALGAIMWAFMLKSGVHATVAGVLLAFAIPGRSAYNHRVVTAKIALLMNKFKGVSDSQDLESEERKAILQSIETLVHDVETPLQRLEHILHVPVNFIIVPVFVLFNAGIRLSGVNWYEVLHHPIALGIIVGLLLGKCVGIFGVTAFLVKTKLVKLPSQVCLGHIFPLSLIAAVGFTMAIFFSELSFGNDPTLLPMAKVSIITASLIAALLGFVLMHWVSRKKTS